jgi:putative transposase
MSVITFQYRIKDSTHRSYLSRLASKANFVWNFLNASSRFAWNRDRRWLSKDELRDLTKGVSQELGLHSQTIQAIIDEFVRQRDKRRKPRLCWRSYKRSLGWIPFPNQAIKLKGEGIVFMGCRFRLWLSRDVAGTIKSGSFTQDARGRWYLNLNCEVEDRSEPLGDAEIGIDLGLSNQIACSDRAEPYSRENLTRLYEDNLAMAQRAGKKKRVKAIHAKIKNVRKDWTHKTTTAIARRAKLIVVGDVSSEKMVKTPFAQSTYDAAWGICRAHLEYKAIRLGGHCVPGREMFSSVTCSACLERTGPSGLSALGVRRWSCSACGVSHHRAPRGNAAQNILSTFRLGRQTPIKGIPRLEAWGGRQELRQAAFSSPAAIDAPASQVAAGSSPFAMCSEILGKVNRTSP